MDRAIKTYVFILFFLFVVKSNVGFIVNLKGNGCSGVFVFGCKKVEDWNCKFEIYGSYNNDLCFILDIDPDLVFFLESIWGITERDKSIFKSQ
jgi:hypothetical protein